MEAWGSDGTEAGTQLVKDINPGPAPSAPSYITKMGDILFFAVGQGSDLAFLEGSGVNIERGTIKVNLDTGATNVPGVFAAGDIAHGAKLFIDAIEGASKAALISLVRSVAAANEGGSNGGA